MPLYGSLKLITGLTKCSLDKVQSQLIRGYEVYESPWSGHQQVRLLPELALLREVLGSSVHNSRPYGSSIRELVRQ